MLPRFFVPEISLNENIITLPKSEAHQLIRVLRLGVGDAITVFDGRGNEFLACVEQVSRQGVEVRLVQRANPAEETSVKFTLAQALLTRNKLDGIVRDATMLGVSIFQPLLTSRTNFSVPASHQDRSLERWRRIAVSSAKQCQRAVVPEIVSPMVFKRFVTEDSSVLRIMLIEPTVRLNRDKDQVRLRVQKKPKSVTVVIGPEGGWTEQEIALAISSGFLPLTLGSLTLRADAAPIAALAILQFLWEDL